VSFYVSTLDFVFYAVEGELASKEFKELPLYVFWYVGLEIKKIQVGLVIYGFTNY